MRLPSCLAFLFALALGAALPARAATYYVDPAGNDNAAGTSTGTAWQTLAKVNATTFAAGDLILFKRGGIWTGRLAPLGSGSSGNVITIDAYGAGALPHIQGNGGVTEAVFLSNQPYWTIRNLLVTNNAASEGTRYGVRIVAQDFGTLNHVHLVGLEVRDVKGDGDDKNTGGIFLEITGTTTPTKFNDVLIDGCYVHHITRTGISNSSTWDGRTATTTTTWTPSTNVVIRNNVIAFTHSNGLIWRVSSAPLIEDNVWAHCGQIGNGNAMFVFNCDDALIQFNEAYGTVYNTGDHDAAGFDADYKCKRTVIQYNYAHDNGRAGIVAVSSGESTGFNIDPVIRYNILQNNEQQGFRISGNVTNAHIYNNTVYVGSGVSNVEIVRHNQWDVWPSGTEYRNNIIYNQSTTASYDLGSSTGNVFDYNLFYGQHPGSEPSDAHKLTSNPKFVSAGSGGTGRDTVDGYKLVAGSPALDSGVLISGNGGLDYFGNTVSSSSAPHRGAYDGTPIPSTLIFECEGMTVIASSGDTIQNISDMDASGDAWLKLSSNAVNDTITLAAEVYAGTYQIQVRVKKFDDRAQVQLATAAAGGSFYNKDGAKDLYAASAAFSTITYTDTVTFPSTGTKHFRFTVTGKNPSSSSYVIALDRIVLTRQ